jgi:hypothetical protein
MNDSHKKQFWGMLNVAMELTNKPPLTKEAILTWWNLLSKYDFEVVQKSVGQWVDNSSKPPTPHDILGLCRPKEPIYQALPPPVSHEDNKAHADKLALFIHERLKPKTDYHAWAKRILKNPQNFPETSVEAARKVLGENYDTQS